MPGYGAAGYEAAPRACRGYPPHEQMSATDLLPASQHPPAGYYMAIRQFSQPRRRSRGKVLYPWRDSDRRVGKPRLDAGPMAKFMKRGRTEVGNVLESFEPRHAGEIGAGRMAGFAKAPRAGAGACDAKSGTLCNLAVPWYLPATTVLFRAQRVAASWMSGQEPL